MAKNPWGTRPSIFGHIRRHLDPKTGILDPAHQDLPDELIVNPPGQIAFAAGALDGCMGHHVASNGAKDVSDLRAALAAAAADQRDENLAALYALACKEEVLSAMDPLARAIVSGKDIQPGSLHRVGLWLATQAPDRRAVKLGLFLLGLFQGSQDRDVFMTLGSHDEFTLFACTALASTDPDPVHAVWELAKRVNGWGRIQTVERLTDADDPAIKDWLLRDGYKNSVMHEYLAWTCAVCGGLLEALLREKIDAGLLLSAGEIIEALINGGPAEDMADYGDGADATREYLRHLERMASELPHLLAAVAIKAFLEDDGRNRALLEERGWTGEARADLLASCRRVLAMPLWQMLVAKGLEAKDDFAFSQALRAAEALGMDSWDAVWKRLKEKPDDSNRWYDSLRACGEARFREILDFARTAIPLDKIATGPARELGFGPGFNLHQCLDFVLDGLSRFPGLGGRQGFEGGWPFIEAALRSPVTRNRNLALAALAERERSSWPAGLEALLRRAAEEEPEDTAREKLQSLLAPPGKKPGPEPGQEPGPAASHAPGPDPAR